jgi:hypothetical protein
MSGLLFRAEGLGQLEGGGGGGELARAPGKPRGGGRQARGGRARGRDIIGGAQQLAGAAAQGGRLEAAMREIFRH